MIEPQKHLSEVVEETIEDEAKKLKKKPVVGHELPSLGIKIIINAGAPSPRPALIPHRIEPIKLKSSKKHDNPKKHNNPAGPMELALKKAY